MPEPPNAHRTFDRLARLPGLALEHLLAALTRGTDDGLLMVYNILPVPGGPPGTLRIHWKGVTAAHVRDYDGPVVGLTAVGILLPDVPTQGLGFRALEPLTPIGES